MLCGLQVVRLFTWVRQGEEPFWIRSSVGRVRVVCAFRVNEVDCPANSTSFGKRISILCSISIKIARARLEERVETCRTPRAHRIWGFVNWLPVEVYAVDET